jgi:BirA family transcriptional regulator, biotin operon repressor / biotin---[acetyl-CoA-carboxylase] ligase
MSQRDSLRGEELRAALTSPHIGNKILLVEETSSTNDLVWQMAQEGSPEGLVIFAESQTGGRGQRGNRWESAAHLGLWFSILLRPKIGPADSARLTDWAAESVARTIEEEIGLKAQMKLPNDIYLGSRKVAGVLVEMRVEKNGGYAAIVGIGVNVNQTDGDFSEQLRPRAGSLAKAAGRQLDRQIFALALLRKLDQTYRARFAV